MQFLGKWVLLKWMDSASSSLLFKLFSRSGWLFDEIQKTMDVENWVSFLKFGL